MINAELVWYGGLLYTRHEVYLDVLNVTRRDDIAKAYAYGWSVKAKPEEIIEEMLAWSKQVKEKIA